MFYWGSSTSSHQVEGWNHNDWTEWEKRTAVRKAQRATTEQTHNKGWPEHILKNRPNPLEVENYISGKSSGHFRLFAHDFDIAKQLGHNAHRFSLEWSRIEPEEGRFDENAIYHYRKVALALRERGIEPFVTIWHWTLPLWLRNKGGILNPRFPEYFERFTAKVVRRLRREVNFWIVLNEPEIYSLNSYLRGIWPPQKKSIFLFYRSIACLIKIQKLAYHTIKRIEPRAWVGTSMNMTYFESGGGFVNDLLKRLADRLWNFHFLNHTQGSLDFIGLNYYFHNRIAWGFNKNKNRSVSDMGWEIYPEGIYHILGALRKYGLPIYVTENGLADARDLYRTKFIADHIEWIKKSVSEGVDVRGYFHWSLLDNFEWDKGYWPRFGLVEVNHKTLERKVRKSALEYKKIIENNPII